MAGLSRNVPLPKRLCPLETRKLSAARRPARAECVWPKCGFLVTLGSGANKTPLPRRASPEAAPERHLYLLGPTELARPVLTSPSLGPIELPNNRWFNNTPKPSGPATRHHPRDAPRALDWSVRASPLDSRGPRRRARAASHSPEIPSSDQRPAQAQDGRRPPFVGPSTEERGEVLIEIECPRALSSVECRVLYTLQDRRRGRID